MIELIVPNADHYEYMPMLYIEFSEAVKIEEKKNQYKEVVIA